MPKMSVMGYELSVQKQNGATKSEKVRKGIDILKKYKEGKEAIEQGIIENEQWYKMNHWEYIRKRNQKEGEPEPVSGYLFSTIANKHADAMDNFPEPNMLPREQSDEEEAQRLSEIVPVILENNDFRSTYDNAWWYKLKNGAVPYGVFWNEELENGLGDIDIQKLDILNVFWEPGLSDHQKGQNFFIVNLVDNDIIVAQYPDRLPANFTGSKTIEVKEYIHDDSIDTTNKSVVVDWYKKVSVSVVPEARARTVVHLTKFVDEYELASTEDDPEMYPYGLYEHGKYPVEFDVLFPEEGMPIGFGYVHVIRNPQMYVDKLDQIITRNALISGKIRYIIKDNGTINEKELLDLGVDVIHSTGGIDETNIRTIQGEPLAPFIVNHREGKIQELKETAGNNDFSRGEGGQGITAASAIMALQEAGNKLSRDMIQRSYNCFKKCNDMVISLIGQFYTEDRKFRIDGKNGEKTKYVTYNNKGLKEQQLPSMYPGEEPKYRKPIFDIKVRPERQSPFSQMAHNELAKELFGAGMFNPEVAQQSLVALEMMQFEGKDKIIQKIQQNAQFMQQMQQQQQQMQMMQQQIQKMAAIIQRLTGQDMGATDQILQEQQQQERLAKSVGQM